MKHSADDVVKIIRAFGEAELEYFKGYGMELRRTPQPEARVEVVQESPPPIITSGLRSELAEDKNEIIEDQLEASHILDPVNYEKMLLSELNSGRN